MRHVPSTFVKIYVLFAAVSGATIEPRRRSMGRDTATAPFAFHGSSAPSRTIPRRLERHRLQRGPTSTGGGAPLDRPPAGTAEDDGTLAPAASKASEIWSIICLIK